MVEYWEPSKGGCGPNLHGRTKFEQEPGNEINGTTGDQGVLFGEKLKNVKETVLKSASKVNGIRGTRAKNKQRHEKKKKKKKSQDGRAGSMGRPGKKKRTKREGGGPNGW